MFLSDSAPFSHSSSSSCAFANQPMYSSMGSVRSISRSRPMAVMRTSLAASLRAAMSSRG